METRPPIGSLCAIVIEWTGYEFIAKSSTGTGAPEVGRWAFAGKAKAKNGPWSAGVSNSCSR